ncbi:MAG: M1 family metallopeptidase [Clostridiales bacterium]|nr:M1 family metallopeptidase [Clostridiales bacterium]
MKKLSRILAMILTGALILSCAACGKETEETKKKKKKTKKTTTEATETTDEPTEDPTTTSEEPTDTTTTEDATATTSAQLLIDVPEKNCPIEIPTDERFHYTMNLELDPDKRTIGGHVEVEFFNYSEDEWDQLCLRDYSSLFIDGKAGGYKPNVTPNGALTEITNITDGRDQSSIEYKREDDQSVVWFPLATKLAPDEKMTLSYDFVATIPTVADRYGVEKGVYNVTNFYPILAVYTENGWSHEEFYNMGECFFSDISDYDVTLSVPEDYTILSTGVEKNEEVKDGKRVYSIDAPCVRDFVFCSCDSFKMVEGDYKDVHIRVVYNEKNPASSTMDECIEAGLQASIDSLTAFGAAFGEYPYAELDVIVAPIEAGGMEYPNLIIITDDPYMTSPTPGETVSYEYFREVVAHEIGHQWFMGIVGSNSALEPWLDESFASYTEIVYDSYMGLEEDYNYFSREFMDLSDQNMVKTLMASDIVPINRPHYAFMDDDAYTMAAYYIGKAALFQMEEILGQEVMYGVVREYVRRNAFTNSTESKFFEVLYECVGKDIEELNTLIKSVFMS